MSKETEGKIEGRRGGAQAGVSDESRVLKCVRLVCWSLYFIRLRLAFIGKQYIFRWMTPS